MKPFYCTPKQAHVQHSTDAPVIAIKAFERGYYPIYTHRTPDELNHGIPEDVIEAAVMGSMFGWNCPGAKPARDYVEQWENNNVG